MFSQHYPVSNRAIKEGTGRAKEHEIEIYVPGF